MAASALVLFFWLVVGHCLCDFPLQGEFLAKAKNHRAPVAGVPWWMALLAHGIIHGGAVALFTGSVLIGTAEVIVHCVIDYRKNAGGYGFAIDQGLHILCKAAWVAVMVTWPGAAGHVVF